MAGLLIGMTLVYPMEKNLAQGQNQGRIFWEEPCIGGVYPI